MLKGFDSRLVRISGKAKDELRQAFLACWQSCKAYARSMAFAVLSADVRAIAALVRSSLSKLERAWRMVVRDPEIRGSEPVIRGTRVPVYLIPDVFAPAAGGAEIISGYHTLKRENLEFVRIYARAYPRRGRPPKHRWHTNEAAA